MGKDMVAARPCPLSVSCVLLIYSLLSFLFIRHKRKKQTDHRRCSRPGGLQSRALFRSLPHSTPAAGMPDWPSARHLLGPPLLGHVEKSCRRESWPTPKLHMSRKGSSCCALALSCPTRRQAQAQAPSLSIWDRINTTSTLHQHHPQQPAPQPPARQSRALACPRSTDRSSRRSL